MFFFLARSRSSWVVLDKLFSYNFEYDAWFSETERQHLGGNTTEKHMRSVKQ